MTCSVPPTTKQTETEKAFSELVAIIARLRAPVGGCPWDQKQTHQSLTPYVIEEAYEVVDAIQNDLPSLKEELGDVLLQIMLHSQIASEKPVTDPTHFTVSDVVQQLSKKMIHRHPHVFGDTKVDSAKDVLENWEKIKQKEKTERKSILDGVSKSFPGLLRAQKLGEVVSRIGFDWWSAAGAQEKALEELKEFLEAKEGSAHRAEELGDLLFTLAQVARKMGLDAETLLQAGNSKFERRFRAVEGLAGRPVGELKPEELEEYWNKVKGGEGEKR